MRDGRSASLATLMSAFFPSLSASGRRVLRLLSIGLAACGGPSPEAAAPAPSAAVSAAPPAAPAADGPLTASRCEAAGGTVVGDIGNGAIHRPDYRCPSGQPPLGSVVAEPGKPGAIEGSVCCPK